MFKGIVSSIDTNKRTAKVIFPELENTVSQDLKISDHIPLTGNLQLKSGDFVVVSIFNISSGDGAIIARLYA